MASERNNLLKSLVPLMLQDVEIEAVGDGFKIHRGRWGEEIVVNRTLAHVLGQCDGTQTLDQLVQQLSKQTGIDQHRLLTEIATSLLPLERLGLLTYCGVPVSDQVSAGEAFVPGTYYCNRGQLLPQVLDDLGFKPAPDYSIAEFSYSVDYNGFLRCGKYQTFTSVLTSELRDKLRLWENLNRAGLQYQAPVTYTDLRDFENRAAPGESGQWMVKITRETEKRGVFFAGSKSEVKRLITSFGGEKYVIQENCRELDLIEGRKYNTRVYVLMTSGIRVFCYQKAHLSIFPELFDPDHYTWHSYIYGAKEGDKSVTYTTSHDLEYFDEVMARINTDLSRLFGALASTFQALVDPNRFQLFGLDYLVSTDHKPILLEVNDWPSIGAGRYHSPQSVELRDNMLKETVGIILSQHSQSSDEPVFKELELIKDPS